MCVCTHVCICTCVCMFMWIWVCVCIWIYVCLGMCVSLYTYTCVHICVFVYVCTYIFMCVYVSLCVYEIHVLLPWYVWSVYAFVCLCAHVYAHVCVVCVSVSVYVRAHTCVKFRWPCCDMHLEVRGQLSGVILSFHHEFQWMNSGCHAWRTLGIATCVWYAMGDCMVSRNTSVCGNTAVVVREMEAVNNDHIKWLCRAQSWEPQVASRVKVILTFGKFCCLNIQATVPGW